MKRQKLATIVALLLILAANAAMAADKVIISYSSRSYAFLPAQVAAAKGFFKDEGLEPLLIQMRSQVTVPALMSDDVHDTLSDGGTIDKTYEFAIESRKATVRTEKPVPLAQVRDLSLLREVQKELKLQ